MTKPLLKRENRVSLYLTGVGMELRAAFHRTNAHKLPGKMGELREDAICKFFNEWLPTKYSAQTNVIPVHMGVHNFDRELDLVILNSHSGFCLPLDAGGGVALVAWNDIKLHVEIKSVLNQEEYAKANEVANACKKFAIHNGTTAPPSMLFAYDCTQEAFDEIYEHMHTSSYNVHLDAIAILNRGIYFSPKYSRWAAQIQAGISEDMALKDGNIATKEILDDIKNFNRSEPFKQVGEETDADILFGIMAFAAKSVEKDEVKAATELIMAAKRQMYSPVFEELTFADRLRVIALEDWTSKQKDHEFLSYILELRHRDRESWNEVLLRHYEIYVYEVTKITYGKKPPQELKGMFMPYYGEDCPIENIDDSAITPSKTFHEAVKKVVEHFYLDRRALNELNLEVW